MRIKKVKQKRDLGKITKENVLTPDVLSKCAEHGIDKPVIVNVYHNKLHRPIGNKEHDMDAGNLAYVVDGKRIISPEIGDAYFKSNFIMVK